MLFVCYSLFPFFDRFDWQNRNYLTLTLPSISTLARTCYLRIFMLIYVTIQTGIRLQGIGEKEKREERRL